MDVDVLIRSLDPAGRHVVHVSRRPPSSARTASVTVPLPPTVAAAVPPAGLWTHQATAIDLIRAGTHTVVATPTASGKSLCFQLPVAEAVGRGGTALLLYPTKALAHDQLRALGGARLEGVVPVAFDGDSSDEARRFARSHGNVVLTNPDMLHVGMLPSHGRWADFFGALQIVVVDELHVLRGIFGTHAAHVLRRLRRVCRLYGSDPTFVFGSATIGNPAELAAELIGDPVVAVTDDGSPSGAQTLVVWHPGRADTGRPRSAVADAASLTAELVSAGRRVITFTQSRRSTELITSDVRTRLGPEDAAGVEAYRGGYLAADRRRIEARLFSGQVRAVVATSALELGIDVGHLDTAVLCGFPGTISAFRQRAGRVGRGAADESLVILVVGPDQLDHWLAAHPGQLSSRPAEPAVINLANPHILVPQVACAAFEVPVRPEIDRRWWPAADLEESVAVLADAGRVELLNGQVMWAARQAPAGDVSLRTGGRDEFVIVDPDGTDLGVIDRSRVFDQTHPGAVYLHLGQAWRVTELDLADRAVHVAPDDGSTTTMARTTTEVGVLAVDQRRAIGSSVVALGAVTVTHQVTGYRRLRAGSSDVIETVALDLPPTHLRTRAVWWEVSPFVADQVAPGAALGGTLHAAEHAAIGMLPIFTICDRWDVGGVSLLHHDVGDGPTIFVYDGYPGGAGVADLAFAHASSVTAAATELVEACPCESGCPSCVQSPKCGSWNEPLDKAGAARLLRALSP